MKFSKSSLISSLNGVIDLLQQMQIPDIAEKKGWTQKEADRVNLLIDNSQKFMIALMDQIPNNDQLIVLVDAVNTACAKFDWTVIKGLSVKPKDPVLKLSIIHSLNGVVDLLQNSLLPEIATRRGWTKPLYDRIQTFIDNLQKVLKALTDDIPDGPQFLQLVDVINEAIDKNDWLNPDTKEKE